MEILVWTDRTSAMKTIPVLRIKTMLYFGKQLVLALIRRSCLRIQNEDAVCACIFRSSPKNEYCTISIDIYKISHMAK